MESKDLSRRSFVKGTTLGVLGLGTAFSIIGCSPKQTFSERENLSDGQAAVPESWDEEADVIIVGGGAAGWGATYEATQAGSSVLLLEKNSILGGDMVLNAGILPGYDSEYTKAAGVTVTADEMWQEYLDKADPLGTPPRDVVEYVFYNCGKNIDFFADAGVEWKRMGVQEWYSAHQVFFQAYRGDLEGGGAFAEPMRNSIEKSGANVMLGTRAVGLITDSEGRVVGVTASSGKNLLSLKAKKAVVLATGGYSANSKLISVFAEKFKGISASGTKSNIGDGLILATSLGALTTRTDFGGFIQPNSEYNTGVGITADCFYAGMIVDPRGLRCIDDGASYATTDLLDEFNNAFTKQEENYLWLVLDSSPDILPFYENEVTMFNPDFITADSLEELAEQMGIDPSVLKGTAEVYSGYAEQGYDPDFGRTNSLHVIQEPPFHAVKVAPAIVMTTGGLKADPDCRVVRMKSVGDADEVKASDETDVLEPIKGLYAAGELVEWCAFTGWSCTSCFTLGRLAGINAAQETSWE